MIKFSFLLLIGLVLFSSVTFAQLVKISIVSPPALNDRKAILLTREKGFAAIVHSIQLGFDTTHLKMDANLLPDLYQLQVSKLKGSLTFFFESGTQILLDTADVSKSLVTRSRSNSEWKQFTDSIQKPSDMRANAYVVREARMRRKSQPDSVNYWIACQREESDLLLAKTAAFIRTNPHSYVSLYLLKINWYAFKNMGLLEKLDSSLSKHRNYLLLKTKKQDIQSAR